MSFACRTFRTTRGMSTFRTVGSWCWLVLLACVSNATAAEPATRAAAPHIVLFIADDLTCTDTAPYGAADVRTPHLDQLAADGMKFELAFAASATCSPSRSALYTGLYPMRNGAHANHTLIKEDVRTLPQYMSDLGYRVVLAGKTHVGPREQFPFEYLADSNVMPPGRKHVLWTDLNTAAVDALLKEHDKSKPLCLVVAAHSPHVFWPENEGYEPRTVTLPPTHVDTAQTRAARCRYYTDVTWMDAQLGAVRASLANHGYADQTLLLFTADQGAQWPFAKWNLYDAGIRAPLLVSWPGKVKPATSTMAVVSLIDLLPTFVEAAGGQPAKSLDGRSFLPVLLGHSDKHRAEVFASHTGDKQMNRTPMRAVRSERYKYIVNLVPEQNYTSHVSDGDGPDGRDYWDSWVALARRDRRVAAVIKRYRTRPAEELYDCFADPHEQRNLIGTDHAAPIAAEMRYKLNEWREQQADNRKRVPMPEDGRMGEIPYAK